MYKIHSFDSWKKDLKSTIEGLKRRMSLCNGKYGKNGKVEFKNKHIGEEILYKAFVSSHNVLGENKENSIEKWKAEDGDELRSFFEL